MLIGLVASWLLFLISLLLAEEDLRDITEPLIESKFGLNRFSSTLLTLDWDCSWMSTFGICATTRCLKTLASSCFLNCFESGSSVYAIWSGTASSLPTCKTPGGCCVVVLSDFPWFRVCWVLSISFRVMRFCSKGRFSYRLWLGGRDYTSIDLFLVCSVLLVWSNFVGFASVREEVIWGSPGGSECSCSLSGAVDLSSPSVLISVF